MPARLIEADLVPIDRLFAAGRKLMTQVGEDELATPIERAVDFRDGLLLAISAASALRLRNLAMIRVGVHLVETGDGFRLVFGRSEMKTARRHEVTLPRELTSCLRQYLGQHRPTLLQGRTANALWITRYGFPMSYHSVGRRLGELTERHLRKRVTSHRVRHCLASSIVERSPAQARIVSVLLGHTTYATSETYYVRASMLLASRAHGDHVADLRARSRSRHAHREPSGEL